MNKTQKTIALSMVLILSLTLSLGIIHASAETQSNADAPETPVLRCRREMGATSLLIAEQSAELDEAVQALWEENATRQEIREYIVCFLEENGVEYTATMASRIPEYSEEQLDLLQQFREDVHSSAQQRAEELGLELPEDGFRFGPGHHGLRGSYGSVEPE